MSCDWLAADVTVAVIGQTINLLPRERCYRRKMVTDLLKTLYSITSDVTFKLSLPTCKNMGSMEILGFYVVTSA